MKMKFTASQILNILNLQIVHVLSSEIFYRQCNILKIFMEHKRLFEKDPDYIRYVPRKSCLICAKPTCNFRDPNCDRSAEINDIPFYYRLFEFGLYGTDLPNSGYVKIPINSDCFLRISIAVEEREFDNDGIFSVGFDLEIRFQQCIELQSECFSSSYVRSESLLFDKNCVFISVALGYSDVIRTAVSTDCTLIASALMERLYNITIDREECVYRPEEPVQNISIKFFPHSRTPHDAVTIIVPCTSGGYAVNPLNGRLVNDNYCKAIYYVGDDSPTIGLIVEQIFGSNENLLFPKKVILYSEKFGRFRPAYVTASGHFRSAEDMMARNRPDNTIEITGRNQCDITYRRAPNPSTFMPYLDPEEDEAIYVYEPKVTNISGISDLIEETNVEPFEEVVFSQNDFDSDGNMTDFGFLTESIADETTEAPTITTPDEGKAIESGAKRNKNPSYIFYALILFRWI